MQEEFFGPVFVIYPYLNDEEAISLANNTIFGLGSSIFNKDIRKAEEMAKKLEFGQSFINSATLSSSSLPWGGVKQSGFGRDSGQFGVEPFANIRTIIH